MAKINNIRFTFLYIDQYTMGESWVYPRSKTPYNLIRYIEKGKAVFCVDNEQVIVEENQIVYIPFGCELSCKSLSEEFTFYSVRFATAFYGDRDLVEKYFDIPRVCSNEGEDYYLKEIYKWARSEYLARTLMVNGYLNLLIGSLAIRNSEKEKQLNTLGNVDVIQKDIHELTNMIDQQTGSEIDSRVLEVTDYILFHPEEQYTPAKMADMVGLSKQRFSYLFKLGTGKSPMEYVREVKLMKAARELLISDKNVNDIAYDIGFNDTNYFIRAFKQTFGITPNRYRKKSE